MIFTPINPEKCTFLVQSTFFRWQVRGYIFFFSACLIAFYIYREYSSSDSITVFLGALSFVFDYF